MTERGTAMPVHEGSYNHKSDPVATHLQEEAELLLLVLGPVHVEDVGHHPALRDVPHAIFFVVELQG